jgi:protein TonB
VHPAQAKADGVEGTVAVRYDVDVDGAVVNARVVRSEPPGVFDAAALDAVRGWRFNAPMVNGEKRMATNLESRVIFKLSGADEYDQY